MTQGLRTLEQALRSDPLDPLAQGTLLTARAWIGGASRRFVSKFAGLYARYGAIPLVLLILNPTAWLGWILCLGLVPVVAASPWAYRSWWRWRHPILRTRP